MFNSLTRVQNVFGFFTTTVATLAALIALTDFASPRTPAGTLVAKSFQV